jgi:hypothetical protein
VVGIPTLSRPRPARGEPARSKGPGGRPRTAIEELRAQYLPHLPEFLERLAELTQSPNEATRLAAIREILDRLLGKPAVFVDATHTKVDIGQLYLAALKRANGVVDGGGNNYGSGDAASNPEIQ